MYIFLISLAMLIFDYRWNVHFYFPHKMGKVLLDNQIFIFYESKIIRKLTIKDYKNNKKKINTQIKNQDKQALIDIISAIQKKK